MCIYYKDKVRKIFGRKTVSGLEITTLIRLDSGYTTYAPNIQQKSHIVYLKVKYSDILKLFHVQCFPLIRLCYHNLTKSALIEGEVMNCGMSGNQYVSAPQLRYECLEF